MQDNRIKRILDRIDKLKEELRSEYSKLQDKYGYIISNNRISFPKNIRLLQRFEKISLSKYIFCAEVRHIISMPFIYVMIFPGLLMDFFLTLYQYTAFPLYGIPKVLRKDYFIYDRKFLAYLNVIEKINCLYCSYMNGLFAYAVEIGGRTEQYWCPIKHAMHSETEHKYFKEYAEYGDAKTFNEILAANICFKK